MDLFPDELIGDGVEVAVHFHMVVDVDPGHFPIGILKRVFWQGLEGWFIDGLKELPAAGWHLFKGTGIHGLQLPCDGLIELSDAEEGVISEGCEDPALGYKDSGFHFSFVSGFSGTGRYDRGAVMIGQVLVGGVDVGLVATRVCDPRFEVIRHDDLRDTLKVFKGMDVGINPAG